MNPSFLAELRRIVGDTHVLDDALELLTYECDALPHLREQPAAVALPGSAAEVQAIVRLCARDGVPFVARGHGTGLSGGALPVAGGLVIALSRLNRVLSVDIPNQRVVVEPDRVEPDDRVEVDQMARPREPEVHHRHQALAAGQRHGVVAVPLE